MKLQLSGGLQPSNQLSGGLTTMMLHLWLCRSTRSTTWYFILLLKKPRAVDPTLNNEEPTKCWRSLYPSWLDYWKLSAEDPRIQLRTNHDWTIIMFFSVMIDVDCWKSLPTSINQPAEALYRDRHSACYLSILYFGSSEYRQWSTKSFTNRFPISFHNNDISNRLIIISTIWIQLVVGGCCRAQHPLPKNADQLQLLSPWPAAGIRKPLGGALRRRKQQEMAVCLMSNGTSSRIGSFSVAMWKITREWQFFWDDLD